MEKIKILCDAISDLSNDVIDKYDIDVIPTTVIFEGKEYKAGVDISATDFHKMLRSSKSMPSTSQITYFDYKEVFEKYVNEGYSILYMCGSSAASGTYQSATLAKNDIEGNIHIFDTYSLSIGGGILVKEALSLVDQGISLNDIILKLEELKKKVNVFFSVSSLDYLHKGGRISGATATIGTILNINPILSVEDGLVKSKTQVRGAKKVIPTLIDCIKNTTNVDFLDKDIYVGCGDDFEQLDKLIEKVNKELSPRNIYTFNIGPCVGAHSGPTVLGIACLDN